MTENGKAKPIETQTLTIAAPEVLDIRDASARGLALMEERVKHAKKITALAISLTSPNQWVVFSGTGPNGEKRESVYPTGGAADRIRHAFGLTFHFTQPTAEDTEDGKLATCEVTVKAGDEVMCVSTGYRYMAGYVTNIAALYSGAKENAKSKAVRDLFGLRFLSKADYKDFGLDLDKLDRRAEFQSHEKNSDSAVVTFGKNKGTRLTDLSDGDLAWHGKAARESVDDPSRSKWKKKNTEWLKACLAEHKRRNPPAEKPAEETTSSVAPESGHAGAVAGSSEPQASGATEPPHDPETGEVTEVGGQPVLCAQPGCDSPATHGVYCGGHLPSQKGQGSLDMREPGEEG